MPGLQLMTVREKPGSPSGYYLAVAGGDNGRSHGHNDVGNLIVYADGMPVLVDSGVEEYTSKTFGSGRYGIWTMQSEWHNLPVVNGLGQGNGPSFRAREVEYSPGPDAVRLSMDIAPAYPAGAKVASWRRTVALDRRKGEISLAEEYVLDECLKPVRLHFLTPLPPDVSTPGRVLLTRTGAPHPDGGGAGGGEHVLLYDADRFAAGIGVQEIADRRLRSVWGERLYRIELTAKDGSSNGSHTITIRRVDRRGAGPNTGY
jgi:hypothetical protein